MLIADNSLHADNLIALDRTTARTKDAFGRLHIARCRIAKASVSSYLGREIPGHAALGLIPDKLYRLYRDPEELKLAADSFTNSQIFLKQHPKRVTAREPLAQLTVGTVGNVTFEAPYLVADRLSVWADDAIHAIESEDARELSPGYGFAADMSPGTAPDGDLYDGVMRKVRGNHLCIVRDGRQGSDITINDSHPSEIPHMFKRPNLIATLVALGVIDAPKSDAAHLALDAQLAGLTAKDSMLPADDEEEEDDPENPGKRRKKINPGKGEPTKAGGATVGDDVTVVQAAAIRKALETGGYITQADAEKLANDAASAAVARATGLNAARKSVEPLVGVVGDSLDSADAVYRFALEKEGVALDGVHTSAYPALVQSRIALKSASAKGGTREAPLAADAAVLISNACGGLDRFARG